MPTVSVIGVLESMVGTEFGSWTTNSVGVHLYDARLSVQAALVVTPSVEPALVVEPQVDQPLTVTVTADLPLTVEY